MRAIVSAVLVLSLAAPLPATGAAPATEGPYRIEMITMSDVTWHAIRYNIETGAAWEVVDGKWSVIKDASELPASTYRVHMVPLRADWGAVRIDVGSGRSWRAERGAWVEIPLAE